MTVKDSSTLVLDSHVAMYGNDIISDAVTINNNNNYCRLQIADCRLGIKCRLQITDWV